MDNDNKRNIANTMEIDSIIREAKGADKNKKDTEDAAPNNNKYDRQPKNFEDNFVIYDTAKGVNNAKKDKKAKNPKAKKTAVLISVITGVLVIVLIAGFCLYNLFADFTYASNIYVNDIKLGGLSESEAKELLEREEQKIADSLSISVKAGDKTTVLTKNELDVIFDTDDVLKRAYEYTENTTIKTGEQRYNISVQISDESSDKAAQSISEKSDKKAQDALIKAFDSSKDGIERFTFTDSHNGIKIKTDELSTQIKDFVKDGKLTGEIEASADKTEPKYTKEYLRKNLKKLSSFTTTSTNNSNGNSNMSHSLDQCNGSIINPGDVWSFNDCTGNSNLESNGYKPAGVIVEGKHTTGVGGGICQSSTTIYNAALLCGMDVVERSCHYYKSTYVDAGRDATVDYGNLDLKMKNVFDYQLVMECYMDGVVLHCNMYGLPNEEFDEIKISSSITSYFSNGFKAATSRTFYKDGKSVRTESLPNSTYYTSEPGGSSNKPKKPASSKKPAASKVEESPSSDTPQEDPPVSEDPPSSDTPVPDDTPPVDDPDQGGQGDQGSDTDQDAQTP